jgi:tetratricopeptide (TPR) repeat protein
MSSFDDGLNTAIKKLRAALCDVADNPRFIETVPLPLPRSFPTLPAETPAGEVVFAARERLVVEPVSGTSGALWAGVAVAAIVLVAGLGYWYRVEHGRKNQAASSTALTVKSRPSIAVLGFHNLSENPQKIWLSTALSEMLTTELAAGEQLRTVPGESVARVKADLSLPDSDSYAKDTLARIRGHVGADFVVLGSFFDMNTSPDQPLRLDLRLQDARSGETVATISANGKEVDLPDLASRVGDQIRQKLGAGELTIAQAASVSAALPSNADAARWYSEGLGKLRGLDHLGARDLLLKAVDAEPNFALAHAALADAWFGLGYDANAREEAEKAFDLSGPLSREQRLWVEGRYREATHEWDKAIETYRSIYRFFPDNLEYGLRLAEVQASASKGREALATLDELRKLPPSASDDPRIDQAEADAALSIGDYARDQAAAARAAQKARALGMRQLVARARHLQCWALHKLGRAQEAEQACAEAQRLFAEAGNRDMVASLLVTTAAILEEKGDLTGAAAKYDQALPIYRETGDQAGLAINLSNLAIVMHNRGDYSSDKKIYAESIAISRKTGNEDIWILATGNLADLYFYEGDLRSAHDLFEDLLVKCRQIGTKDRIALQLDNLSQTLFFQGDLQASQRGLEEAIALDSQSGEKRQMGYHLAALGDVLQAKAQLPEARQYRLQSLQLRKELGDEGDAADTRVALADGSIEEGHPAEAEGPLREALVELQRLKMVEDEASVYPVLAHALLSLGRPAEALSAIEAGSAPIAQSHNRGAHLAFEVAAARVRAANGQASEASESLRKTEAEAARFGFVGYVLDARLALAQIEMNTHKSAAARSALQRIEEEAKAKGYLLLARKAAAARQGPIAEFRGSSPLQ